MTICWTVRCKATIQALAVPHQPIKMDYYNAYMIAYMISYCRKKSIVCTERVNRDIKQKKNKIWHETVLPTVVAHPIFVKIRLKKKKPCYFQQGSRTGARDKKETSKGVKKTRSRKERKGILIFPRDHLWSRFYSFIFLFSHNVLIILILKNLSRKNKENRDLGSVFSCFFLILLYLKHHDWHSRPS